MPTKHNILIVGIVLALIIIFVPLSLFLLNETQKPKEKEAASTISTNKPPTPTPPPVGGPTTNWKTYTNTEVGYQIKYPAQLKTKEFSDSTYPAFYIYVRSGPEYLLIQARPNYSSSIELQKKDDMKYYRPWGAQLLRQTSFADKEALLYSTNSAQITQGDDQLQGKPFIKYIVYPNIKIVLGLEYFGDGDTKVLFDQILSTFKFLDQTVDTSNWKTYANEKYGVSIQYPSNWKFSTSNYINDVKDYVVFSIYKDAREGARLELYKDFQGDFCAGSPETTTAPIMLNNGIKGEKTECSSEIAINFKKDGNDFWLKATFINDGNREIFKKMISTLFFKKTNEQPEQVFCTQDAKLCPDGSYVGRSGPKCEFAPCPSP